MPTFLSFKISCLLFLGGFFKDQCGASMCFYCTMVVQKCVFDNEKIFLLLKEHFWSEKV